MDMLHEQGELDAEIDDANGLLQRFYNKAPLLIEAEQSQIQLQSLKPDDPMRAELERAIAQDWERIGLPKGSYTYAQDQQDAQKAEQRLDVLKYKRQADALAISDYLNIERPAQDFTKAMSEICAALIGLVIVGFIALFSVVIAINIIWNHRSA
jgi:hypothetical protein